MRATLSGDICYLIASGWHLDRGKKDVFTAAQFQDIATDILMTKKE